MSGVIACRVEGTWVNLRGKLVDPRYVFCVDLSMNLGNHLIEVGVHEDDQVVSFASGRFSTLKQFFSEKHAQYNRVRAIILLWIGSKELGQEAPQMPLAPAIEAYFHPLGPRIYPRLLVDEFVAAYHELTVSILSLVPLADVFSTDAPPQRSAGFMTKRALNSGKKMDQMEERHHHFTMGHKFHGVDKSRTGDDRVGGRLYLFEDMFEGGVQPTTASWKTVFERAYAAIDRLKGSAGDQGLLRHVRLKF